MLSTLESSYAEGVSSESLSILNKFVAKQNLIEILFTHHGCAFERTHLAAVNIIFNANVEHLRVSRRKASRVAIKKQNKITAQTHIHREASALLAGLPLAS